MKESLEILKNNCKNYQETCEFFFGLARDNETRINLESILYEGKYKDSYIDTGMMNIHSFSIEAQRRLFIAHLLITNPETVDVLFQNNIKLFHGTNSNALPSILKYGLNSAFDSKKNGVYVTTGEFRTRNFSDLREFVSFTDVLEIASMYSRITPESKINNLSFGIIIGTTTDDVLQVSRRTVWSMWPELGVMHKLPKERIRAICVPTDKVEYIKKIINNDEIKILTMDRLNERFYAIDYDTGTTKILYDRYNELKENLQQPTSDKKFKLEEIKELMLKQISKIVNTRISKIKGE